MSNTYYVEFYRENKVQVGVDKGETVFQPLYTCTQLILMVFLFLYLKVVITFTVFKLSAPFYVIRW